MKIKLNEIVENEEFKFSILETLGIFDQEIIHSNMIKFLFDHTEKHGLYSSFLESFLKEVEEDEYNIERNLDFSDLELLDYKIFREFKLGNCYFDLFIVSQKTKTVILLENKVSGDQHNNQLSIYLNTIKQYLPQYKVYPIYLTLKSDNPRTIGYYKADYSMLYHCLKRLLNCIENIELKSFLEEYLLLLYQLDQYYNK